MKKPLADNLLLTAAFTSFLGATCAANAQDPDLYSILNNSQNKSPNITWSTGGTSSVSIGAENLRYTWANNDGGHGKYTYRQTNLSGDVTADFIGAQANGDKGGAIFAGSVYSSYQYYHYSQNLATISGSFIGNRVYNDTSSWVWLLGGAVYYWFEETEGSLTEINADFIGNHIESDDGGTEGGAIYIVGGDNVTIHGNFIGNHVVSGSSDAYGGAIAGQSTLKEVVGNFIGNYAYSDSGWSYGGAIYADFKRNGGLKVLSGDFINNFAIVADDDDGRVRGGAIYNSYNEDEYETKVTLVADGSTSPDNIYQQDVMFKGNYVQQGTSGEKKYEAIYNGGTLVFDSRNGGSFTFYDYITSASMDSYVRLSGDSTTGVFNLYNDILGQSTFSIEKPYTFNMVNQTANTVRAGVMSISAPSSLNLDASLSGEGAVDKFIVSSVSGEDNFTLNNINIVDDMDADVEIMRLKYSNKKLTGNDFSRTQATGGGVYTVANDGEFLTFARTSGTSGYAAFLTDLNNQGANRSYSFTKDENMAAVIQDGSESGKAQGEEAKLTVYGNNKTLNYAGKNDGKAMNLAEDQVAEINSLTVKGFDTAFINSGKLTLNGVNLNNNKTALKNTGELWFKGENTISGGNYAMFFEKLLNTEYPLFATYMNTELVEMAADSGISYEQTLSAAFEEIRAMGYDLPEEPSLYPLVSIFVNFLISDEVDVPEDADEFTIVSTVLENQGVTITRNDYDNFLQAMKEVSGESPYLAYYMLRRAVNGKIYYSIDEMIDNHLYGQYSEDIHSMDELVDYVFADEYSQEDIDQMTEDEIAACKQEIREELEAEREDLAQNYEEARIHYDPMFDVEGAPDPVSFFENSEPESTINFAEGAILNLNSKISGEVLYRLILSGAKDARINLNSTIEKADLVLDGPVLKLFDESKNLAQLNSFEVKSGTLDLQNERIGRLVAPNFKISGKMSLFVDADLAAKTMDTLGKVTVAEGASISVDGIKILKDSSSIITKVLFAEEDYKDVVSTTVSKVISANYSYDVAYDAENGEFVFKRGEGPVPSNTSLNNASAVAKSMVQVLTAISDQVAEHSSASDEGMNSGDQTDIHTWVKVFGADEDVKLKRLAGGIDTQFQGIVGGVDSDEFA